MPITWLSRIVTGWGNGYVVIPKGHPAHGKDYDDINIQVHGGLTFSSLADEIMDWEEITKKDSGCWVIGFDCAHYQDTPENCPRSYVQSQNRKLVKQLNDMLKPKSKTHV